MKKVHGKLTLRNRNNLSYKSVQLKSLIAQHRRNTNHYQEKILIAAVNDEFTNHVLEKLVTEYNIPEHKALKNIKESVFTELLEEDPDFVFHHNSSFWANAIFNEKYHPNTVMN